MNLSDFGFFWQQLMDNPLLMMAVLLTMGVILVNGWTDAPNAIATCVVTRCMSPRLAILMAAVCNFLGVLIMSMLNATVAETITKMVDFGDNTHEAIIALSAALIAGLTGSAINFGVVKEMAMTWILTFPGCGLIGFIMTKIFIAIF